jgi:hypothetical protein
MELRSSISAYNDHQQQTNQITVAFGIPLSVAGLVGVLPQ